MAYAFDIKQVCGGYAYYSAFSHSLGVRKSKHEIRKPSEVCDDRFKNALYELGHTPLVVDSEETYRKWSYLHGWALVDEDFARRAMPQWLRQRPCIVSPVGSFTDIGIVSPGAIKRNLRGKQKARILHRDGGICLRCGSLDELTLQHVLPYSSGGETTWRNLVTLCVTCNQGLRNEVDSELFRLAKLPYLFEPSLTKNIEWSHEVFIRALQLSQNLMHSRCEA